MVDAQLPIEKRERPLRHLFLDLNSYFASVEQQEDPALRGKPVAVVPVMADTSFVIAASYEAKTYGVKCGVRIGDAKRMCADLTLIEGRPPLYVSYHKKVLETVETILPIEQVCSIDEMRFKLLGVERTPQVAVELAKTLKSAIREKVGEALGCSIGIAPNPFLAKVGTELEKPDGLVVLTKEDLPTKLFELKITDFPGINRRMGARLNAAGIFTARQLCEAEKLELYNAFGSITGERWWYLLRGFELEPEVHERKTLGHSHVLSPDLRTDHGCREVLLRLLQKASARLRSENLWATGMVVAVQGFRQSWSAKVKLPPTQDTITLNDYFLEAWQGRSFESPKMVGVTFFGLHPAEEVTPSLFDATQDRALLNRAVDELNQKFGKNRVHLAGMIHAKDSAPERIAFNKTWLFKEGKGDQEWIDPFRGLSSDD